MAGLSRLSRGHSLNSSPPSSRLEYKYCPPGPFAQDAHPQPLISCSYDREGPAALAELETKPTTLPTSTLWHVNFAPSEIPAGPGRRRNRTASILSGHDGGHGAPALSGRDQHRLTQPCSHLRRAEALQPACHHAKSGMGGQPYCDLHGLVDYDGCQRPFG